MTNGTSSLSKKKGKQILLAAIIISAIVAALIVYQNSQKIEPQTIPSQLDAQIIQKALPQNDQTKKIQPGSELTTTSISLSWRSPSGLVTTDYSIQYSTDNTNWVNWSHSPSSATSQTITGLSSNTAYYFRVAAVNAGGIGAYTSSVSRTTLPDTPSSFGVPIQSIPQPPEQPVTPEQPTAPEQPEIGRAHV